MIQRICVQCKSEFNTQAAWVRRGERNGTSEGKFCKRACYHQWRRDNLKLTECICEWCGKKFNRRSADVRYIQPRYCSRSCRASVPTIGYRILNGYKYIYSPNHPNRNYNKQVAEHRLVVERDRGRYLDPKEVVHHINFNKLDNRLENLVILTRSQHETVHLEHKRAIQRAYWTPERRAARGQQSRERWAKIRGTISS